MEKFNPDQLHQEYQALAERKQEFDLELEKAKTKAETPKEAQAALQKAKKLQAELERKRDALREKLWPFEALPQKELQEQYEGQVNLCREKGLLETLSNGQEGIKDEEGKEHPILSLSEITSRLKKEELFKEKIEVFEKPFILMTPFALSAEIMKDKYSEQIEKHFVQKRIEGEDRIPDETKTKLFGVDGKPLELRVDKQNVYFDNDLKNLFYFPEWKKEGGRVKAKGGLTKKEAIKKFGGWQIKIIEGIPLSPKKGQGKTIEKEIRIKGKTKKVKRELVEGGLNAVQQYELFKKQNEEGLIMEDWLFYAMFCLEENNTVLDDDQKTNYLCRLLGARTAGGDVPYACWFRDSRRACLGRNDPEHSDSDYGVRPAVRV